jgi:hypothetical protein
MSDKSERLDIPVSDSIRSIEFVDMELLFDDPYEFEGEQWNTYYYTVRNLADNQEYSLGATTGLHKRIQKLGVCAGTVISVGRVGSGKETVWDVSYISGPTTTTAKPVSRPPVKAQASAPTQPKTNPMVWEPLTQEDANVMLAMAENHLEIYELFYGLVATRQHLAELSDEQQARIATGAMISVSRQYRRGMVIAGQEEQKAQDVFIASVELHMGTDEIVDVVIDGIVTHTKILDRRGVISLLRDFGMSSQAIKDADADTIMVMYDLCDRYATMTMVDNWDQEDAKAQIAKELDLHYDGIPF